MKDIDRVEVEEGWLMAVTQPVTALRLEQSI
jgi:hypothetical protein